MCTGLLEQILFLFLSELQPPSNVTMIDSTPISFAIQWSSYTGNATLLGYRVLVLRDGNLEKNLTVDSKTTSVNIQDLAVLTEYCVRIRLIAEQANGNLSDCFNFTTKEFHGKFC